MSRDAAAAAHLRGDALLDALFHDHDGEALLGQIHGRLSTELQKLESLRARKASVARKCEEAASGTASLTEDAIATSTSLETALESAIAKLGVTRAQLGPMKSELNGLFNQLRGLNVCQTFLSQLMEVLVLHADSTEVDAQSDDRDEYCEEAVVVLEKMHNIWRTRSASKGNSTCHLQSFLQNRIHELQLRVLRKLSVSFKKVLIALSWPAPLDSMKSDAALWKRFQDVFCRMMRVQLCYLPSAEDERNSLHCGAPVQEAPKAFVAVNLLMKPLVVCVWLGSTCTIFAMVSSHFCAYFCFAWYVLCLL